jgi:hypothetical protein
MSDHDLLLADTITTMVTDETDQRVELVADGILWRGTPVSGSTWARDLPQRQDERTPLRDRLAVGGYLHLDRARHRSGEGWARAGRVRLRSAFSARARTGSLAATRNPPAAAGRGAD